MCGGREEVGGGGGGGAAVAETGAAVRLHSSSVTHLAVMATSLLTLLACMASLEASRRLDMRQSEACYHQPYNRELVCQCRHTTNYLSLSLSQFVDTARQEVGADCQSCQYTDLLGW